MHSLLNGTLFMLMWQIPMCGFGGVSQVEVMNARRSTSGSWIDMGEASALSLFRNHS